MTEAQPLSATQLSQMSAFDVATGFAEVVRDTGGGSDDEYQGALYGAAALMDSEYLGEEATESQFDIVRVYRAEIAKRMVRACGLTQADLFGGDK